jgi:AcrR family transcriptional regulator
MVGLGRKGRKRLSPAQRREEILAAAHRVFAAHDPSAVTFEEIAAEAGVSRALVYNYFGDKGSLLAEVYRQALDDLDHDLIAALGAPGAADARLRDLVTRYVAFARTRTGTWRLLGHIAVVQHPAVQAVHQERVAALAAALGDEPDLRVAIAGLLGLLEGATRQVLDLPDGVLDDPLDDRVRALEQLAWSGLSGMLGPRTRQLTG